MQIGTKGIKYGLQLPKQKVQPAQQPKKLNVFGGDDGSDDEAAPSIGNQIARQAAKKQNDKKVWVSAFVLVLHVPVRHNSRRKLG